MGNYFLPGCGVICVCWQEVSESHYRNPRFTKSRRNYARSCCATCGLTRINRVKVNGLNFCSSECQQSFDPEKPRINNRVPRLLPEQSYLNEILFYDSSTGFLYWKNGKRKGNRAFGSFQSTGYYFGSLDGKKYLAHRIIWKMVYGEEPIVVDHINNVKSDNRLENLRNVTQQFNISRHFN